MTTDALEVARLRTGPPKGGGRPFNTTTPLGQMMARKGVRVGDMAAVAGIPERHVSDYLAGRKDPPEVRLVFMARALGCRVSAIRPPEREQPVVPRLG